MALINVFLDFSSGLYHHAINEEGAQHNESHQREAFKFQGVFYTPANHRSGHLNDKGKHVHYLHFYLEFIYCCTNKNQTNTQARKK